MSLPQVLSEIVAERNRQIELWGVQNHDPFRYLAVLMEEVGELAQAAQNLRAFDAGEYGDPPFSRDVVHDDMREEAVQVAAVALSVIECIDRGSWRWPQAEENESEGEQR